MEANCPNESSRFEGKRGTSKFCNLAVGNKGRRK